MNIIKGDIVLVPFPFTNLESIKERPALVIYCDKKDILLCGITSKFSKKDIAVKFENNDLTKGKLPVASYVKVMKIASLEISLVKAIFGNLSKSKTNEVIEKISDNIQK